MKKLFTELSKIAIALAISLAIGLAIAEILFSLQRSYSMTIGHARLIIPIIIYLAIERHCLKDD